MVSHQDKRAPVVTVDAILDQRPDSRVDFLANHRLRNEMVVAEPTVTTKTTRGLGGAFRKQTPCHRAATTNMYRVESHSIHYTCGLNTKRGVDKNRYTRLYPRWRQVGVLMHYVPEQNFCTTAWNTQRVLSSGNSPPVVQRIYSTYGQGGGWNPLFHITLETLFGRMRNISGLLHTPAATLPFEEMSSKFDISCLE